MSTSGAVPYLRALPTFSGLAVLVALLLSLPWLPITSPPTPRQTTPHRAAASLPSFAPRAGGDERFSFFVFGSVGAARAFDPAQAGGVRFARVVLIDGIDEAGFESYLRELNTVRSGANLPLAGVVDLR